MDAERLKTFKATLEIYKTAIGNEVISYQKGQQTEAEMMNRIEKYKEDFYVLYQGREEGVEPFDAIYEEIVGGIKIT